MNISPLAVKPATPEMLINVARLQSDYYQCKPNFGERNQRVSFGTSVHRGTSTNGTFTEAHILAITKAVCDYRRSQGIDGPTLDHLKEQSRGLAASARTESEKKLAHVVFELCKKYRTDGTRAQRRQGPCRQHVSGYQSTIALCGIHRTNSDSPESPRRTNSMLYGSVAVHFAPVYRSRRGQPRVLYRFAVGIGSANTVPKRL